MSKCKPRLRPVTTRRSYACAVCGQGMWLSYRNYRGSVEDGTFDWTKFDLVCESCFKPHRPHITRPGVLLAKEHHSTWHYLVRDDEELFRTALSILKRRHKDGCYYFKPDEKAHPKPAVLKAINADKEAAEALRKGKMRDAALVGCTERLEAYQRAVTRYKDEQQEWNMIVEALAIKSGRLAWQILVDRSGGDDESMVLEPFADIDEE